MPLQHLLDLACRLWFAGPCLEDEGLPSHSFILQDFLQWERSTQTQETHKNQVR